MPPTIRRLVGLFAVCATSPFGKPPCVPVGWSRFSRCPDAHCILLPSAIRWNGPKVLERNQSLKNRFVLSGQQEFLWQDSTRRHPLKPRAFLGLGTMICNFPPIGAAFRGTSHSPDFTGENSQRSARREPVILAPSTRRFYCDFAAGSGDRSLVLRFVLQCLFRQALIARR